MTRPIMIQHLLAQLDSARLDRHQRDLRLREQAAITRLGQRVLAKGGVREGRLATLAVEADAVRQRLEAAASAEKRVSASGKRAGTAERQRREALEAKLTQLHLTAGRLALAMPAAGGGDEVETIRAELAAAAAEQERVRAESRQLAQDSWTRVREWLAPRSPALGGMLVGWWVARSYAESHTSGILTALGYSANRRGLHLVSLRADTVLVQYGLPLVAAGLSAYLGQRAAQRVRASVDEYRARASQRASVLSHGPALAAAESRDLDDPRHASDPRTPRESRRPGPSGRLERSR